MKLPYKFKLPNWKICIAFVLFEILIIGVSSPLVIFYGPFTNLRKTVVGTAMSTFTHRYIATTFLSQKKIDEILTSKDNNTSNVKDTTSSLDSNDTSDEKQQEIKIPVNHDNSTEMYQIQGKKSKGYLLVIKDPSRVRVGITSKLGKEGEKTSDIAKEHNAIAAINGGAFTDKSPDGKTWCGTGGLPGGVVIIDGKTVYSDAANNDQKYDVVAFTKEGKLVVGKNSINEMMTKGVRDAISFGPTLILNGKEQYDFPDQGYNPRTAIGQRKDGAILFLVMDGRQAKSLGASLEEIRGILMQQGAINAINLDGGSSSTMYYEGDIVNNPSDPYGERTIATAIYVEP